MGSRARVGDRGAAPASARPAPSHGYADSWALCEHVRRISGDTCLLSHGCGKDSTAAWSQLRNHFARIVPFCMILVPGLKFVERSLAAHEERLGQPILRVPHPSLPRMLRKMVFQPPERAAAIEAMNLPLLDYDDVAETVRQRAGCPGAYVACGDRVDDGAGRRATVARTGPLNAKRRRFMAIYDWSMDDVEAAVRTMGCGLPVDYELFSRSFDGLDHRFLAPIRERFPEDYATILRWFPLADLELRRREWA